MNQQSRFQFAEYAGTTTHIEGELMKYRFMPLILFFGILITNTTSVNTAWAQAAPQRIEVTSKRFAFDPGEITLKKGQPVVLVLRSTDVAHGLRFRELNVNVSVRAGGQSEVHFTPNKTGAFVGRCSVFCGAGHGAMTLKLHVVE
jgi:cytochrome c oxidase subunit II